jgi:transposase
VRSVNKQNLLTTEEVAEQLGYSARTITLWACAWEESGGAEGLPGRKIGRGWRFEPSVIENVRTGEVKVVSGKRDRKQGPTAAIA